eukprot:gnl/TRDRNA2_/TRDRNA2_128477_c0_seq1.p3 gnl/TRDRNA2_/TRDRNA2_128477_c0~~gnl/TRDRNA2_/TRDRNA2_128477_c0_seq1.p3  ORF type:complete len:113 (-),score=16.72 gnl/TRDRNA2_/TRDRNA2_128477_c0_seq1:568-906(-)
MSKWEETVVREGDVYLSSPSFYTHRFLHHTSLPEDPSIAIHLRLGFPPDWASHLNQNWGAEVLKVAHVVADHFGRYKASINIPSLEAVKAAESRCCAASTIWELALQSGREL